MDFTPLSSDHPVSMELEREAEVAQLARMFLNREGLFDWEYRLSKTATIVGRCFYEDKVIEFSSHFINEPWPEIQDTILHEIAHALVGSEYTIGRNGKRRYIHHGSKWRAKCREIGANPNRTAHPSVKGNAEFNYVMKCQVCSRRWYRIRMKRQNFRATHCGVQIKVYRLKKG